MAINKSDMVDTDFKMPPPAKEIPTEIEVFGVTYERYALERLFARLVKKLGLRSVLEIPASGAKAMPSLYSLGFALAGCQVTLVDAQPDGLKVWQDSGLTDKLTVYRADEIPDVAATGKRWDLCWNFMQLPISTDPQSMVKKMASYSRKWLMTINVNRFNVGFSMHRTVHKLWKIPWTHGDIRFFSPFHTCRFFSEFGYKDLKWGVVDSPPWPDSPGFRDLRLHRLGENEKRWVSPYIQYLKDNNFPGWYKWVYRGERFPLPRTLKLPYSHLYWALCRVNNEADQ